LLFHRRRRERPLVELVREEVEWYWRARLGRLGGIYLAFSSLLAAASSIFVIYILLQPLVEYRGFTLSGFISSLRYSLYIVNNPARYPVLDSLSVVSTFIYLFALITLSLSVLGVIGVFKEWRSWVAFVPASTGSASLLVSLLYSLLRVYVRDVIPSIPYTITVEAAGGRVYLEPPSTTYTWIYWLAWRPQYFFVAFNLLIALSAGSLVILILKPKPPVTLKNMKKKKLHQKGGEE